VTIISIQDNRCWICDTNKFLTTHHALPIHLKPKHNILIPICDDCHKKKLNTHDVTGLYAYTYKINKILHNTSKMVEGLVMTLDTIRDIRVKEEPKEEVDDHGDKIQAGTDSDSKI